MQLSLVSTWPCHSRIHASRGVVYACIEAFHKLGIRNPCTHVYRGPRCRSCTPHVSPANASRQCPKTGDFKMGSDIFATGWKEIGCPDIGPFTLATFGDPNPW